MRRDGSDWTVRNLTFLQVWGLRIAWGTFVGPDSLLVFEFSKPEPFKDEDPIRRNTALFMMYAVALLFGFIVQVLKP